MQLGYLSTPGMRLTPSSEHKVTDYILNCYNPSYVPTINPTGVAWSSPASFADDYREMLKLMQGSAIMSYPMFQSMWLYADIWGMQSILECNSCDQTQSNIDSYLDLVRTGDHIYSIQAQTPATATTSYTNGLINFYFCTFQSTLIIQPSGFTLGAFE